MASNVLDIIRGLNQAAANCYDGYELEQEIGLKREEGHPILDSRVIDGFRVRFAADKMMVTYQSEMLVTELHPRNQFENEIENKFADIIKFLKKEYKKLTGNAASLSPTRDADIIVQGTSRRNVWVQATKQYNIGGMEGVESVRKISIRSQDKSYEEKFRDYLDKSTDKRPPNDTAPKNSETPEG